MINWTECKPLKGKELDEELHQEYNKLYRDL